MKFIITVAKQLAEVERIRLTLLCPSNRLWRDFYSLQSLTLWDYFRDLLMYFSCLLRAPSFWLESILVLFFHPCLVLLLCFPSERLLEAITVKVRHHSVFLPAWYACMLAWAILLVLIWSSWCSTLVVLGLTLRSTSKLRSMVVARVLIPTRPSLSLTLSEIHSNVFQALHRSIVFLHSTIMTLKCLIFLHFDC